MHNDAAGLLSLNRVWKERQKQRGVMQGGLISLAMCAWMTSFLAYSQETNEIPLRMRWTASYTDFLGPTSFSADGQLVAKSGDSTSQIWETHSGKLIAAVPG
jgi:hypothetical protein